MIWVTPEPGDVSDVSLFWIWTVCIAVQTLDLQKEVGPPENRVLPTMQKETQPSFTNTPAARQPPPPTATNEEEEEDANSYDSDDASKTLMRCDACSCL